MTYDGESEEDVARFNEMFSVPGARGVAVVELAAEIGMRLAETAPAVPHEMSEVEDIEPGDEDGGYLANCIPAKDVDVLAEVLLAVIAEVIQGWIDAGSEREVTMENEDLRKALTDELKGWSSRADMPEKGEVQ